MWPSSCPRRRARDLTRDARDGRRRLAPSTRRALGGSCATRRSSTSSSASPARARAVRGRRFRRRRRTAAPARDLKGRCMSFAERGDRARPRPRRVDARDRPAEFCADDDEVVASVSTTPPPAPRPARPPRRGRMGRCSVELTEELRWRGRQVRWRRGGSGPAVVFSTAHRGRRGSGLRSPMR